MGSAANQIVRLYGPWLGPEESETRQSAVHLGRSFNVEVDGEEIRTRPGLRRWANASGAAIGMASFAGTVYVATARDGAAGLLRYPGASGTAFEALSLPALAQVAPPAPRFSMVPWASAVLACHGGSRIVAVAKDGRASLVLPTAGLDTTKSYLAELPPISCLAVFQNRVFAASGGTVLYSEADNFTLAIPTDGRAPFGAAHLWPASQNFDAKTDPDDFVQGLVPFAGALCIVTRHGVFVWNDAGLVQLGGYAAGAVAPQSIQAIPHGIVFLGEDGPRVVANGESARVDTGYDDLLRELTDRAKWDRAVGVHVPWRREYRLYLPSWKGIGNDLCLVWKYEEKRWFLWGYEPPWLPASGSPDALTCTVAGACTVEESGVPRVLTVPPAMGAVYAECDDPFGGFACVAFKRLGLGEDEAVRTWRNVRIEARANGAVLKLAMLADGEVFGAGAATRPTASFAATALLPGESTWDANGDRIVRYSGGSYGPVSTFGQFLVPHARVARTMQPVVWCDGRDAAGIARGGAMALRGIEIEMRPRRGRR